MTQTTITAAALATLTPNQVDNLICEANKLRRENAEKEHQKQIEESKQKTAATVAKITEFTKKYYDTEKTFKVSIPVTINLEFAVSSSHGDYDLKCGYQPDLCVETTAKVTVPSGTKISKEAREMVIRNITDLAEESCNRILLLSPAGHKYGEQIKKEGKELRDEVMKIRNAMNLSRLP